MIRYNNISRPSTPPTTPPATLTTPLRPPATPYDPLAQNLGVAAPNSPGLTPLGSGVRMTDGHSRWNCQCDQMHRYTAEVRGSISIALFQYPFYLKDGSEQCHHAKLATNWVY